MLQEEVLEATEPGQGMLVMAEAEEEVTVGVVTRAEWETQEATPQ